MTPTAALLAGAGTVVLAGLLFARHALRSAHDLGVTRVEVPVRGLGPAFEGYTIVALADLHHWPSGGLGLGMIERAVDAAAAASPDMVALLGDYSVSFESTRRWNGGWYERAMASMSPVLGRLAAPDGVYGVLGNHDHHDDPTVVTDWLASIGVRPLVNACVTVRRGGDALVLCGVDDAEFGTVDLDAAAAGAPDAPTIVLSHNPDGVLMLGDRRRVDLVLAGHTHGGQYVLPWIGVLTTHSRVCTRTHPAGWVPNERAPLYVSRGVGVQTPGRIGSAPEVVVVKLVASGER